MKRWLVQICVRDVSARICYEVVYARGARSAQSKVIKYYRRFADVLGCTYYEVSDNSEDNYRAWLANAKQELAQREIEDSWEACQRCITLRAEIDDYEKIIRAFERCPLKLD